MYHGDFLHYWAVNSYPQFLLLPNHVGKIAITSHPTSRAVSCSLLRIIVCFSLLTLRRSRALSMLNSAESTIIFSPTVSHQPPWEICEGSSNIDLTWLTYVWPSTNCFLRTLVCSLSKYRVFWQAVFQTPRPHSFFWITAPPSKF